MYCHSHLIGVNTLLIIKLNGGNTESELPNALTGTNKHLILALGFKRKKQNLRQDFPGELDLWLRIDAFDVARHPDLGLLLVLVVDRVFHPDVFGLRFKKLTFYRPITSPQIQMKMTHGYEKLTLISIPKQQSTKELRKCIITIANVNHFLINF